MNRRLRLLAVVALVSLVAASCGDDDDESADLVAEQELPAEEEAPAEQEVPADEAPGRTGSVGLQVSGVTFDSGNAFVINTGDSPVDLTGMWICNRPTYAALPPLELAPGEGIEVPMEGVDAAGGEAAIYSSDNFDSSDDMISYVHWGSGGGRTSVAEAAGLWVGPAVEVTGEGVFLIGDPGSAEGWN